MRLTVLLAGGALAASVAIAGAPALAETGANASLVVPAVDHGAAGAQLEKVQYLWAGRNYCWYPGGWHGPGYYWCGYAWRSGFGWGGPVGWNGWRWHSWGGGHGWHGGGWGHGGWHGGGGWRHGGGGGWRHGGGGGHWRH